MKQYWAHSVREGTSEKHGLEDHLTSTARLAGNLAKSFDPENLAFVAGLFHDLGKFYHEFQDYLDDQSIQREHRDHSTAGGIYAFQNLPWEKAFIVSFLIFSHHSGLIPARQLMKRIEKNKNESFIQESLEKGVPLLKQFVPSISQNTSTYWNMENPDMISLEMRIRMLFSALVDADFLDTEHHFYPNRINLRRPSKGITELYHLLMSHYQTLEKGEDASRPINRTRASIYHQCLENANDPHPFYILSVPTGLGKTLSSMGFALKNARKTSKKRVIVALPFTSIIDQNAAEYKRIFGDENVLEHHSRAVWGEERTEYDEKMKLASENWDIPIVVTSTVQLFESLFANKTSAIRKLHNIADSVIVLDEFQMLPLNVLEPIFATMEELMCTYNVTFVASSATPLSFEWKSYFRKVGQPIHLVKNSDIIFQENLRVSFNYEEQPKEWDNLSEQMLEYDQALAIVNTKKDALNLYQRIKGRTETPVYHLSTLLCSKHRQTILSNVRKGLDDKQPIYLISTQLIEAGVDIDFPIVFRALAPLDSIIQAAGRCNREGKLSKKGQVVIFEPSEGNTPEGTYRMASDQTKITLKDQWDVLHLPTTYIDYFKTLYRLNENELDKKGIQERRVDPNRGLEFPGIAADFQMIEDDTVSVVCPYDEAAEEYIDEIDYMTPGLRWFRRVQPYVVNLPRNDRVFKEQPESFREIANDWFVLQTNIYDQNIGLNRSMEHSSEQLNL